ncbi:MAG: N-acetyl-gamma-glutamyl-phosphate reductase, partial [Thermoproteota archaeon]|nr:N-acetyl-gamma-glutamyl-phosphate reductase [Thermoproteota archaeon]
VALSASDNLMKGAAGSAIQNMNVMVGYRENEGLMYTPLTPV